MAALEGILSGIANVANAVVQPISAKRQQKRNYNYATKQMVNQAYLNHTAAKAEAQLAQQYYEKNYKQQRDDQYERENYLLANQKAIEVKALRDAGLNPALANGVGSAYNTSAVSASAPSVGANVASQGSANYASLMSNVDLSEGMIAALKTAEELKLMKAQSRKINADAKATELDNEGTEDANRISTYYGDLDTEVGDDGKLMVKFGDNDWISADNYPRTKKGMECLNDFRKAQSNNYEYHSKITKSELDNIVSRLQIDDPAILVALSSIPEAMYNQIRANSSKTEIEKELLENEKYIFRNLEDGSINSIEDLRKALVSILYTFFGKK